MKTRKVLPEYRARISREFRLDTLQPPVMLEELAEGWGVRSIEELPLSSEGLIVPSRGGYKIAINQDTIPARRRFSLAHELAHLLLHKSGISDLKDSKGKRRGSLGDDWDEEALCDQIAADILMPRMAFYEDGWMEGWSIKSLKTLAQRYQTSLEATAIRMVDLMPEESIMGVWRLKDDGGRNFEWWSHRGATQYGLPAMAIISFRQLGLIISAWKSNKIEFGEAPVKLGDSRPVDVPAEAMSYGRGTNHKVMVFYYPTRQPTSSPV